jgi:hypothetical protein
VNVDMNELALKIYAYPRLKPGLNEDDCGDFYLYYYPKLLSILARYEDRGTPFHHYLNKSLKWELRRYIRNKKKNRLILGKHFLRDIWQETALSLPGPGEQISIEPEPPLPFDLDQNGRIKSQAERKQALFHSLAHSLYLTGEHVDRLAVLTGMGRDWIQGVVDVLNQGMRGNQYRRSCLITRINRLFFGIRSLEQMMDRGYPREIRESVAKKTGRMRHLLNRAIRRFSRIKLTASFRKIAQATGFPRGTICSAANKLKKRLTGIHEQEKNWYTPGSWKYF